jgi:preprotein translocase subunit SecD
MNRYPLWKNILIVVALLFGLVYTLPNFYGDVPAVQVTSVKATVKVDAKLQARIEDILNNDNIKDNGIFADSNSIRVRFTDTDTQLKAKDAIEKALNPDPNDASYSVALNLISASPRWLTAIHALPMNLGLDLRGGVHFLLQVDMKSAIKRRLDTTVSDLRGLMRDKNIRYSSVSRDHDTITATFRDAATRDKAHAAIADGQPDLVLRDAESGQDYKILASLKPKAIKTYEEQALKQNIITLQKRINEIGVGEPIVQQQGSDRIVVELPGVQDVAQAKDIIGRTATLEVRMVAQAEVPPGEPAPLGTDLVPERRRDGSIRMVAVKKHVVLTGDRFNGAQATFDENHQPAVAVQLDSAGGRIMREVTRENLHKMMAILLIEKGRPEAISVATIQGEFGNRFQITGMFTPEETTTLAILIRSGAIAAPMDFIEERVIGPSLGAENIKKGFDSTLGGFIVIGCFMFLYYMLFGLVSVLSLSANLLFLVALLSVLQATLTLPGIAAIALTLGMAIDSNVLINERVREELRGGTTPQAAITAGYERAWATIVDSNVTTLIVGLMLYTFGSGPVRGFAIVHVLGILTSIFSSVVVSRGIINFIYGRRKKLAALSIGQVWKPGVETK